jgi:hypothetical protein
MKKVLALVTILVTSLMASFAIAHVPSPSGDCDTWSRTAHAAPSPYPTQTPSHHRVNHPGAVNYDNLNDFSSSAPNQPLPNGTLVHTSSGHYVAQTGNGAGNSGAGTYVEVVGGGQYEGEPYVKNMGEGGYVQGRVDGNGTPAAGHHVDFHANTFGPVSEGSNAATWDSHVQACVSVDGDKHEAGQTITCPVPGNAPDGVKCY